MRLASFLSLSDPDYSDRRRRITSFTITIVVHLLLLLMLLKLAPPFVKMASSGGQLLSFTNAPEAQEETTRSKSTTKTSHKHAAAPPTPTVPPPKIVLQDKAAPWVLTPGLEKFDVRQVPQTPQSSPAQSDASASDEANGNSDSDRPVAYGRGGQPLYAAAWYREPTDAELSYYLKDARPGPGYGEIACQTVARYHVDNCEELDETPGSGLGRAVREAAWQFLVLPPRIGGRMQVGTWVRIRIDYSERRAR
jgi:protein TonB